MLISEACRPEGRSETGSGVCSTCLAADRVLFSLQKTPQLVNICNELALSVADMVCYECRAILSNFVKFRSRALRAQRLLSCVPPSCRFPQTKMLRIFSSSGVKCLSTLTLTVISPNETIYIDRDSAQVKLEIPDSHCQVKPEVSDLTMTVEPSLIMMDMKIRETVNDVTYKVNTKLELEDEIYAKSASDNDDLQLHDPLITKQFTVNHIELAEVLSHMEVTRDSSRYKRAPYKCKKCALAFNTDPQYRSHSARHRKKRGNFKCEVCKQRYRSSAALELHTATHFTRYSCRHCTRSCDSYPQMYFHYRSVHDQLTPRFCTQCPARFTSKRELKQHTHRAHGRRYPCASCERQYATSAGLQRHMLVHDTTVPELECEVCHKKYKGEINLKSHVRNVHELKPGDAYCVECNMQFKDSHQYKQHLKTTSKHIPTVDYKYECDHCGKRFTQKPTLIQHIEVLHLKLAKYKCDVCNETFHTKRYAVNHARRKHSDEPRSKKHVCHICAKAFTVRKSLDEHMNAHLGLRPFECKLCGAKFAYNSALFNHNQLVHLKRPRKNKKSKAPD